MKYTLSVLVLAFVFWVAACTPPVVFNTAYPTDGNDLTEIPLEYQGAFICDSDSSIIIIQSSTIAIRKEQFFRLPLKHVEEKENCMINGDEMYVNDRKECIPIVFENDSIVRGTVIEVDTLFNIAPGSLARLYKGHVVLSQEVAKDKWAINLLTLQENGDVIYRAITDKTEVNKVSRITTTQKLEKKKKNGPKYLVKPTMAEFDELINNEKVFIICDYLSRINLEQQFYFIN